MGYSSENVPRWEPQPYASEGPCPASRDCDYCDPDAEDDYYAGHVHHYYVTRSGASTRTADALARLFCEDVYDMLHDPTDVNGISDPYKVPDDIPWVDDGEWLEDADVSEVLHDEVQRAESALYDAGYRVAWDDGYVISTVSDPIADARDRVTAWDVGWTTWEGETFPGESADVIYRVMLTHDDVSSFDDYDAEVFGRVEVREYRDSQKPRPDGFTGRACKLQGFDRGAFAWYEPPASVAPGTDEYNRTRQMVSDILEYGWQVVGLERCEGVDGLGHPIVTHYAALGGVEPPTTDEGRAYVREVLSGLWEDIRAEMDGAKILPGSGR